MNLEEHLLTCLAEECAEVTQRVSKALRFGLDEVQTGQPLNNAQRIVGELRDLVSVIAILESKVVLPPLNMNDSIVQAKFDKINKYLVKTGQENLCFERKTA